MAVSYNDNNMGAIVGKFIKPELVNNIVNDEDPVLMRLLNDAKKFEGENYQVPLLKSIPDTGGSYSGFDTLNTVDEQVRTAAEFEDRELYESITVNSLDKLKGRSKMAAVDHVKAKMESAQKFLAYRFATQLYSDGTGNSSKDIDGLDAVCDDGTNVATYAGIDKTTETWFQGQYTDSAAVLTEAIMDTHIDEVSDTNDDPTMIVTTYALWSKLSQLLGADQQTLVNGYQKLAPSYKSKKPMEFGINGGFNTISYRGIPVVRSKYAATGYMYFLNEKYLQMFYRDQAPLGRKNLKKGFAFEDMIKAQNQDGEVGRIHFYGNLVCDRPGRQGVRRGLTTS